MLNRRTLNATYIDKTLDISSAELESLNRQPLRITYAKENQLKKLLLKSMLYGSEEKLLELLKRMFTAEYIEIKDDTYGANMVLWAVLRRQYNILNYLFQKAYHDEKILMHSFDNDKNNCFIYATFIGDLNLVKKILKLNPNYINSVNVYGENGLMIAIASEFLEMIKYFLQAHSNLINLSDEEGNNAFLVAAYKDNYEMIIKLLAMDPKLINSANNNNENAFIIRQNINIALLFLSYNIQMLKVNNIYNVKQWFTLLGLSNEEDFSELQQCVNDMGRTLIILDLKIIEEVLFAQLPLEIINYIIQFFSYQRINDIYPNIAIEYQIKREYLELLKQRCAREILEKDHPTFNLVYSSGTNYIKALEEQTYQAPYQKKLTYPDDDQVSVYVPYTEKRHLLSAHTYLNYDTSQSFQIKFNCEIKFPLLKNCINPLLNRHNTSHFTARTSKRDLKLLYNVRHESYCLQ